MTQDGFSFTRLLAWLDSEEGQKLTEEQRTEIKRRGLMELERLTNPFFRIIPNNKRTQGDRY